MRICTFYDTRPGRNDGPPLYWTQAFKHLGHEVVHLTGQEPPDAYGKFDLYVWIDWGEDALTGILNYTPIDMSNYHPSMYVASDTHLGLDYRRTKAKEFDYVFVNQSQALELIPNSIYLPHAVDPHAYPCMPQELQIYDTCFVGFVTFEKRAKMLDQYLKAFPEFFFGQRLFEDCAKVYRQSKIVFNTAAVDDLNMRVFETLATGSFLLTEYVPDLERWFRSEQDLVWYHSVDEAIDKAKHYIAHPKKRAKIAATGRDNALSNHRYIDRATYVLKHFINKVS